MKWYQDDLGNVSAMRIITVPGSFIGMGIAIAGVVAMFLDKSTAGTAITVGAGMAGLSEWIKMLQKKIETNRG